MQKFGLKCITIRCGSFAIEQDTHSVPTSIGWISSSSTSILPLLSTWLISDMVLAHVICRKTRQQDLDKVTTYNRWVYIPNVISLTSCASIEHQQGTNLDPSVREADWADLLSTFINKPFFSWVWKRGLSVLLVVRMRRIDLERPGNGLTSMGPIVHLGQDLSVDAAVGE